MRSFLFRVPGSGACLVAMLMWATSACGPAGQPARGPDTTGPSGGTGGGPATGASKVSSPGPLKKLTVLYSATSGSFAPLWVALEAGYFAKYGLEVETTYVSGSSRVVPAILSGESPIGEVAGPNVILARLQGADLVMLAVHNYGFGVSLMGRPEIRGVEDLRGRKVGIAARGSVAEFGVNLALKRSGLEPGPDVAVLAMGGQPEVVTGLSAGAIDAGITAPPQTFQARDMGFRELLNLATLKVDFPGSGITATSSYVRENPETVRAFLKGYLEGIHRLKSDREFAIGIMGTYTQADDKDLLAQTYDYYLPYIESVPYPSEKAVRTALDLLGTNIPEAASADASAYVDGRLLRELEDSGFIRSLGSR